MTATHGNTPDMRREFDGKVAVVVGAGSADGMSLEAPSVGTAISLLLAREGCRVALVGQGLEGASRTAELIRAEGGEAFALKADVSREEDCARVASSVLATYGQLDVLVHNLGIRLSSFGVTDISADEWDRVMDVNVKGLLLMAKHVVPHLPPGGAIVNTSGTVAVRPTFTSSIAYATSKGAINTMTIALATQLSKRGIRVNAVCPGNLWTPIAQRELVRTGCPDIEAERDRRRREMVPLGIEGTAWDVARAVAFLASDQARWITGQLLAIDGGSLLPARS